MTSKRLIGVDRRFIERRKSGKSLRYELLFALLIGFSVLGIVYAMYFGVVWHLDELYAKQEKCVVNAVRVSEQYTEIVLLKDKLCFDYGYCE
jgi:hypothetical protein